jgi:Gpi18-like mannosyltransferase
MLKDFPGKKLLKRLLKFMLKLFQNRVFGLFLTWRVGLFLVAFLATLILPFKGSFPYINQELIPTHLPSWVWGFGNFDGVHYLRLAQMGYSSEFTQAFFPIYPLLVYLFSLGRWYFLSGLVISNLTFLLALYFLFRLFVIDYSGKVSYRSVLLLLAFPTAFYFGAVYSESTFLLPAVLTMLFARRKQFLIAAVFAAIASATRVIGIFLWLFLLIEIIQSGSYRRLGSILGLFLAPLGLIFSMIYLKLQFNNPLYFLTAQSSFGAQRSSSIVLLPQVLVRYIKIFGSVPAKSYPFFTAVIEFLFTVLPMAGALLFFKKIRLSYLAFVIGCLFLPTLTGTLSSMPRYALMVFPILPLLAQTEKGAFKIILVSFIMAQIVFLSLFVRGYWIA